jgi:UDP-3-O-[3-hydroxymyristoyl] glucosamine N-acyltransferase
MIKNRNIDPTAAIAVSKMEEGAMTFVDTQLTNAQVLVLATTAGEVIVAAPGANKAIIVHAVWIVADASDTAWTEPSAPDDLVVQYAGGTDITAAIESGALVANSVNLAKYGVLDTELLPVANEAIHLFNTGANWGGGDTANTMSVRTWYSVVDTVAFK